ncbi:sodium ion-translocating decarboxylase subunit beta [Rhodoplanes sp. TEM]|uniref:oxaloacetate decarboxylase (Na(+) extruding) n=1 Tax=Rhodoplanes tepidamans TaxID=200616 RepID=A0ABT5JK30_RHOTP|nr:MULTISPECIES: sodium ion-translocating decarboxylase subunit beta [Rhodoplanes]MDC7789907.1 sodium ion-translocating decarboxylase subunit beta [Rhodoplanes tepidamans]MDC7986645.1 sodium ion-translocating decarboxylase subunit beta [Rhodoplanes sp. TEM]MDQ0354039.1 oxaloacetate decarboxylase beta subunit [Rhodoplanes tepidamans]
MPDFQFLDLFQGVATLVQSEPTILIGRIALMGLGVLLIYLGQRGVLEALLMIPMGLGMATANAGVLFLPSGKTGTLFLDPLASGTEEVMTQLQIDWLQPIYTFAFSNGLIACLVFLGIGTLLDVGYVMQRPFRSMFLAVCGELGTLVAFPLGVLMGLIDKQAAATATIGGADGPMVLFTSLILAPELFVPITVVGYLYLGLTYGGYPYLIKLMVPKRLRAIPMPPDTTRSISASEKMVFAVVACLLLSLLFPVAAPLFLSLFLGVIVRESGLSYFYDLFSNQILYGATFFLGLVLGVLCEASTILNPKVLILLVLGIVALTVSAIGGILGGYVLYWLSGGKYNPVIGIAAVSCVPTTAKVAQKVVTEANRNAIILPHALGASISGVITSAIFAAVLVSVLKAG